MTIGVVAALVVGEWVTAAIVVFFMRVGDYAERFTTERSRQALKHLTGLAPQTARVERSGHEIELPVAQVQVGDIVIVRPGEKIPVDGTYLQPVWPSSEAYEFVSLMSARIQPLDEWSVWWKRRKRIGPTFSA
jgi:magnesium-transporting ATPase (P-type)